MYNTVLVTTKAHRYTEINLYTKGPSTYISQQCYHPQRRKIQRMAKSVYEYT